MSVLTIAFPAEAASPVAQMAIAAIRPLLGLSLFAGLLVLFKPMIAGLLRAAILLITSGQPIVRRIADQRQRGVLMLNRMARELDATQPNQAAELRNLVTRD